MKINWTKLALIAMFIVAVSLFAFFIYYFFFRPLITPNQPAVINNEANANTNQELPGGANANRQIINGTEVTGLPGGVNINSATGQPETPSPTATGGLTQTSLLTDKTTLFIAGNINGEMVYYNPDDGKFYRINADGQSVLLSNKTFYNVSNVVWANGRDKAIIEYPDNSKIIFDFATDQQITLPKHWEEFSFSSTDQQIAFKSLGLDIENRFLTVAKADGSGARTIEPIGDKGDQFQVNWSPNQQMFSIFTEGKDLNRSDVYFIGLNNENFKLMTVEGRDFRPVWSTQGDKILYSVYNSANNYKPELWISSSNPNNIGDNRVKLDLQTWGDKCSFSGNEKIYCAVPESLPDGAALMPEEADNIKDMIYEIDLKTGVKKIIAIPDGSYAIGKIMAMPDSNFLFFTDKNSNQTYKIKLK